MKRGRSLRLLPDTLVGQAIMVLLIGLSVSHVISMLIYSSDRIESLAMMGGHNMAQRVANLTRLVAEVPVDWRPRLVEGLDGPGLRVSMSNEPPSFAEPESHEERWRAEMARRFVAAMLPREGVGRVLVHLSEPPSPATAATEPDWMPHPLHMMLHGGQLDHGLLISVQLEDGSWLNFGGTVPEIPSLWSDDAMLSMLLMAAGVMIASIWVVRRLTRPLRTFAQAAERLGRDVSAPAMDENGPREVRQAAHAFNDMQERLRRLIENRSLMLAAISHDLRTPITLLRLRVEAQDKSEDRERMLETIDEMEQMISSTLEFFRQDALKEDMRKVDLTALVQSLCDDLADAGMPVTFHAEDRVVTECRPLGLKRAVANLIGNALEYGGNADVFVEASGSGIRITVEDDGPGIDKAYLDKAFQPFFRVEGSRSRETGGVGLGLSIAQSIAHGHGGEIRLEKKTPGLRAVMTLPG